MIRTSMCALLCLAATPLAAEDMSAAMKDFYESRLQAFANDPTLVEAVQAQNEMTSGYDQADIDALDQAWRAEIGTASTPTITPVLGNSASEYLRGVVADAGGTITEVFVMDAQGLNVAASAVTSDYWQGDEDKFSKTYSVGPDAVHFGEIEFDESTQTFQGQISLSIVDPATSNVIGAMTFGVNAESLY